jgi:uncharacterized protein
MTARGRFLWFEYMTPDPEAARAFYCDVVGWSLVPFDESDDPYMMFAVDGVTVGGVRALPPGVEAPPHWLAYFGTDDLDATLAQAVGLGGAVLMPAMAMPGVGRFATLRDPHGAVFAAFQPERPPEDPADPTGPGHIAWMEHACGDHPAAWDFYAALFGWAQKGSTDMGHMGEYRLFTVDGERGAGGFYTVPPGMPIPPNWQPYATVADFDASLERAKALGAKVLNGPMDVPGGDRIATLMDPSRGSFSLHASPA